MNNRRKLVVITIVKDDFSAFLKTLESVYSQSHLVKHITVDGSVEIEVQNQISTTAAQLGSTYCHQKANGIYSAMNFGLSFCSENDMVLFLNAGDCFAAVDVVSKIDNDLLSTTNEVILYPCVFGEGRGFIPSIEGATAKSVANGKALICHQGFVASARLIRQAGTFDETYAVSADHKLILQLLQMTEPIIKSVPIAIVSLGGVSDTSCGVLARENSRARAETGLSLETKFQDKWYTTRRAYRCRAKLVIRKILKSFGVPVDFAQRIVHRS
jgi:hypothetical protein